MFFKQFHQRKIFDSARPLHMIDGTKSASSENSAFFIVFLVFGQNLNLRAIVLQLIKQHQNRILYFLSPTYDFDRLIPPNWREAFKIST